MENHIVKNSFSGTVTHDVKRFTIQKPEGLNSYLDRQPKCP
jgi:hypothetical protein